MKKLLLTLGTVAAVAAPVASVVACGNKEETNKVNAYKAIFAILQGSDDEQATVETSLEANKDKSLKEQFEALTSTTSGTDGSDLSEYKYTVAKELLEEAEVATTDHASIDAALVANENKITSLMAWAVYADSNHISNDLPGNHKGLEYKDAEVFANTMGIEWSTPADSTGIHLTNTEFDAFEALFK